MATNDTIVQHTALPWRAGERGDWHAPIYGAERGDLIAEFNPLEIRDEEQAQVDRAFALRACNAHDDLLAALKGLLALGVFRSDDPREEIVAASAAIARVEAE